MLKEVRQAIADAVSNAVPDMQASAHVLANPTPPCAWVYPTDVTYDEAMGRGMDTWTLLLQAFVAEVSDISAQARLDEMLEPVGGKSIKAAVETKDTHGVPTLGGLVFNIRAVSARASNRYVLRSTDGPVLGAEWTLEIKADGGGGP